MQPVMVNGVTMVQFSLPDKGVIFCASGARLVCLG